VVIYGPSQKQLTGKDHMQPIETSRRERKKDETRERISRAAIDLFAEKGFDTTTVDEIAQRADVAKGTFFNYFPRKEAVLTALAEDEVEEFEAWVEAKLAEPGPARDKLFAMVDCAVESYEQDPALRRLALIELQKGEPGLVGRIHARGHAVVRRVVEAAQADGSLRADLDPDRATALLRSTYIGTMMQWLFRGDPQDVRGELRARLTMLLDGLAQQPGSPR
jgi:AcrR family transcriptional regulator